MITSSQDKMLSYIGSDDGGGHSKVMLYAFTAISVYLPLLIDLIFFFLPRYDANQHDIPSTIRHNQRQVNGNFYF